MTDHRDPDAARDELASAYLDGEVTPEEVAAVEADAELLEHVAAMGQVRAAIAALDAPVADADRDAAIAAALGALATDELAEVRARKGRTFGWPGIAAAAAAIVVVLATVGIISQLGGDSGSDSAETAERVTDSAGSAAGSPPSTTAAAPLAGAPGAGSAADTAAQRQAFGSFPSVDALTAALRTSPDRTSNFSTEESTEQAGPSCPSDQPPPPGTVGVMSTGGATVAGAPVTVVIYALDGGGRYALVVDQASAVVFSGEL